VELVSVGDEVVLVIKVKVHVFIPRLVLGYKIKDLLGRSLFGTNADLLMQALNDVQAGEVLTYRFRFHANLGYGSYAVSTALHSTETHLEHNYEWRELALVFEVLNPHAHFEGCNWMLPTLEIQRS
jgi:lipopolysaccharide transport system ATP-binding protein